MYTNGHRRRFGHARRFHADPTAVATVQSIFRRIFEYVPLDAVVNRHQISVVRTGRVFIPLKIQRSTSTLLKYSYNRTDNRSFDNDEKTLYIRGELVLNFIYLHRSFQDDFIAKLKTK